MIHFFGLASPRCRPQFHTLRHLPLLFVSVLSTLISVSLGVFVFVFLVLCIHFRRHLPLLLPRIEAAESTQYARERDRYSEGCHLRIFDSPRHLLRELGILSEANGRGIMEKHRSLF